MVQEKQLKELFKYIESNWDVCVSQVDKTDIKRIFGGVLCEDIMNDTLHEVKAEPALNPIAEAYERGEKIRHKDWRKNAWIQKLSETETTSDTLTTFANNWDFTTHPEKWELYTEPIEQPSSQGKLDNSSMTYEQAIKHIISNKLTHKNACNDSWFAYKFYGYNIHFCDENGKDMIWVRFDELDLTEWYPYKKPFDKERFEAMFRAVLASWEFDNITEVIEQTEYNLNKLDAYYATKEGGNNG